MHKRPPRAPFSRRSIVNLPGDFTDILIRSRVISSEQLAEARRLSKDTGKKVADELIRLGYATGDEVMRVGRRSMDSIS